MGELAPQHQGPEVIRVNERDFRRYAGNLDKLRQCQMDPLPDAPRPAVTVSFKERYSTLCRGGDDPMPRDPWQGLANPEKTREQNVQDLIVNQVWDGATSPRKYAPDEMGGGGYRNEAS